MNHIFEGLTSVIYGDGIKALKTPCYVIDEKRIQQNAEVLSSVMSNTGCKILLAQKAFSNYDFYPLLSRYLAGTEASGLYEARLGKEEMPEGEVHTGMTSSASFLNTLTTLSLIRFISSRSSAVLPNSRERA